MVLRRSAISAMSILESSVLQAVAAQFLFLVLLLLHLKCMPYASEELTWIDTVVLLALLLTQFGCVVVATMSNWRMNLSLTTLNVVEAVIGWALMLLNVLVFLWMAFKLAIKGRHAALRHIWVPIHVFASMKFW
jgi:hypothetical protein